MFQTKLEVHAVSARHKYYLHRPVLASVYQMVV